MTIQIKVILFLVFSLCLRGEGLAKDKTSMEDKLIGSTFKALAKAFVMVTDFDKLKQDNIEKLNKMNEEKFKKRYAKAYVVLKDLPAELKANFRITEEASKEEVIKNMQSLDKPKIYEMINSIPDTFIAHQFKQYLSEKKQEFQKSNVVEQINKFWNKITEKAKNR